MNYKSTDYDSPHLSHYGRKGMKWGKNIFSKAKSTATKSKAARADAKYQKEADKADQAYNKAWKKYQEAEGKGNLKKTKKLADKEIAAQYYLRTFEKPTLTKKQRKQYVNKVMSEFAQEGAEKAVRQYSGEGTTSRKASKTMNKAYAAQNEKGNYKKATKLFNKAVKQQEKTDAKSKKMEERFAKQDARLDKQYDKINSKIEKSGGMSRKTKKRYNKYKDEGYTDKEATVRAYNDSSLIGIQGSLNAGHSVSSLIATSGGTKAFAAAATQLGAVTVGAASAAVALHAVGAYALGSLSAKAGIKAGNAVNNAISNLKIRSYNKKNGSISTKSRTETLRDIKRSKLYE